MITISKKYADQIKQVCSVASNRCAIHAFENVYISAKEKKVNFKAGDSLIELSRYIDSESFESGFETTVNAAKFLQAFNACQGDVTLIQKDDLTIKSGRTKFTLPTISPESYPSYQDIGDVVEINAPVNEIVSRIKAVAFAAGRDDARAFFNGVYLGDDIVASNGHVMAVMPGYGNDAIIPISAVSKLPDDGDSVMISDNVFCIFAPDFTFKTKLIDHKYPDYRRAMPKTDKRVTMLKSDLVSCSKSAAITANQKFKTISFKFGAECSVSSTSESKKENALVGFEADASCDFDFALNSSYLIDALNSIDSDAVVLEFSDTQLYIDHGIKIVISGVRL